MNFYIFLENENPSTHPVLESNLVLLYPEIDLKNLPNNICKFIRVEKPIAKWDETIEGPEYKIIDGICYDVWTITKISEEERQKKIADLIAACPYPSWTIDYENYNIIPLKPYPESGEWEWDESILDWVEV
jgi:hypothetical protein